MCAVRLLTEPERILLWRKYWKGIGAYILLLLTVAYLVLLCVLALPTVLVNFPVAIAAKLYSSKQAVKAKKKSSVKIHGHDVISSFRILLSLVGFPLLYTFYFLAAWVLFDGVRAAATVATVLTVTYSSLRLLEEIGLVWKNILPIVKYLRRRKLVESLLDERSKLQTSVRELVERLGPAVGSEFWRERVITKRQLNADSIVLPDSFLSIKRRKGPQNLAEWDDLGDLDLGLGDSSDIAMF